MGLMFDAIQSGGPGGEVPLESWGGWGAAGPPIPFCEVKKKQKKNKERLEVGKKQQKCQLGR